MNAFLHYLSRRTPTIWTRYGLVLVTLSAVTLFRLVVPLDTAPFLLYLPVVFMLSVALGRGPGLLGTAISALYAASFFTHPGAWWQLRTSELIALIEYLLVSLAMVEVCGALRSVLTENEAALARLSTSETNLRTIVDTVPVGILFAEAPSGRLVGRNKRMDEIVGVPTGAPRGLQNYGDWIAMHGDGRQVAPNEYPVAQIIKGGADSASLEMQYERRDGTRKWIAVVATATRDTSGRLTGAVAAVSDIDERKRAEEAQRQLTEELSFRKDEAEAARNAAEAANRAKSAFLANMSHELRTPLSAVIGYTELLEEELDDIGQQGMMTDLGKIKSNAKHLLGLINDVLDLSKVEANKMEIFVEDIEVESFLRDAAGTVETLVRTKANTLALDLGQGLGSMRSDPVKLRQCLYNLLSNACKFTANGRVTLRVGREAASDGDWLSFAVEDTGIGMSPQQVERLFERFTQADETTTRKFGGTGLGLALSRAFANLLGGDITVTSTEGEGTCFVLRVPAVAPEVRPAVADQSELDSHHLNGSADSLVLVVDDEPSQRELLTRFLRKQGFSVRTCSDGRHALVLARDLKPRVILLDVMMPDMDGWSVLQALKADEETAKLPVIMVSFVADPSLSIALGATDAVPKPIDWTRLRTVMDRFRDVGGDVLVVDDDRDTRIRLRTVLEKNGWTVREAGDGAEALHRVAEARPRIILLDLTMPLVDGFAFLDCLREIPDCADVPVVVLSARDVSAAERERLAKADRVFRKGEMSLNDLTRELRSLDRRVSPEPH